MSSGGAQFHLMPPFFDVSGNLISDYWIYPYIAGSSTSKTVWSDEGKTTPKTSGTDPKGGEYLEATKGLVWFYADGDYKFVICNNGENLVDHTPLYTFDNIKITSDTATMWEGNTGTAWPSATAANLYQLFALIDNNTDKNFNKLGFIEGSSPAVKTILEMIPGTDINKFTEIVSGGPVVDIRHYLTAPWVTDGSEDYSAEIQAAIDSLQGSAGVGGDAQQGIGGIVFFPPGVWSIGSTTLDLLYGSGNRNYNIHLMGCGPTATSIKYDGSGVAINVEGASGDKLWGFKISEMTLNGVDSTGDSKGIRFIHAQYSQRIDRVDVREFKKYGIHVADGTEYLKISNCRIRNIAANVSATGVYIGGPTNAVCKAIDIESCLIEYHDGYGILSDEYSVRQFSISKSSIFNNSRGVFMLSDYDGAPWYGDIIGNYFASNGEDMEIDNSTFQGLSIDIRDNVFASTTGKGLNSGTSLSGTVIAVEIDDVRKWTFINNTFRDITSTDVDSVLGISVDAQDGTVRDNYYDNVTVPHSTNNSARTDNNVGNVDPQSDLSYYNPPDLITITSGVIVATAEYLIVSSESGTSDTIDTINLPNGAPGKFSNGRRVLIRPATGHTILLSESGNMVLNHSGVPYQLDTNLSTPQIEIAELIYDDSASKWVLFNTPKTY